MIVAVSCQFRLHRRSEIAPILVVGRRSGVIIVPVIIRIVVIGIAIKRVTEPKEEAVVTMEEMVSVVMMKEMIPTVMKCEIM